MSTNINAHDAAKFFQDYHGNPSQPKLKNKSGTPIQGFIIEDADYVALKQKAGADFAGIMAVPAHNSDGDDTIILVGLKLVSGKYELVLPPNATDLNFIIDFVVPVPPVSMNTNFNKLSLPNWGC